MTDSVAVFSPGDRLTDNATAAEMSGAVAYFYDAGTTTPRTVYADADLLTALGTSVTADSLGYPTSDGTTKTLVYTGTSSYKVVIKDSDGNTIVTHDNVKGAPATVDPGNTSVTATTPVVTKSLDYTVLTTDQSTVFVGNCSSADVTFTLPSAVTAADGWFIDIQHAGSANQVLIATVSSQTISSGATSYSTVMVLQRSGESVRLTSDGGNWRVTAHSPPHVKVGQGIITVADRLTAPPGSEVNGDVYLISGAPSGDWSSFSAGQLVQYTSSAWVAFTALEGWVVWVKDEDVLYRYDGSAWASEAATTSVAGTVRLADQTAMEAETAGRGITADVAKYSPGAAKAWINFRGTGTAAINADYGFASLTDDGTGAYHATMDTAMSSINYAAPLGASGTSNATPCGSSTANTTTNVYVNGFSYNSGTNNDLAVISVAVLGDQ